jgi:serine/threonine-protein kinase
LGEAPPEIEALFREFGLDPGLHEPVLGLVRRLVGRAPTEVQDGSTLAPSDDATGATGIPPADGPPPNPSDLQAFGGRPEQLGLLGKGGMGAVYQARDAALNRMLAMKVLAQHLAGRSAVHARFLAEAQVTAQLAHPGIPPVHAVGELENGQPYFTMKEIHGQTLAVVIARVRAGNAAAQGWTEARRLDVYQKVCEAVAYAHARGVVHCDLKPANIMVGAFGEVLVVDWGVARLVEPAPAGAAAEGRVELAWYARTPSNTAVVGTPAYMAPEQAIGNADLLGPAADVYALGVILYELLTGERPYTGEPIQLLMAARKGIIPQLRLPAETTVDESLTGIVRRAMRPNPNDRFADGTALAAEIARWREGSLRRERALAAVREAEQQLPGVDEKRARAQLLRERADYELAALPPEATSEQKRTAWQLEDDAAALERDAGVGTIQVIQKAHSALALAPELREANALLAKIHHDRHREAERRRDWDAAAREEVLLSAHDTGEYARYLAGVAELTLVTDPPAAVRLHRYVPRGRKLVPGLPLSLGKTPLIGIELPVASWLLELDAGDRPTVHYPVVLRRSESWNTTPPGGEAPETLALPAVGVIGPEEVLVPGGWALLGGDAATPPSWVWVDGFAITRHPVTARELFAFLADAGTPDHRAAVLRSGVTVFGPDWPATGVPWEVARAYAAWKAEANGLPWRLPTEAEWEKAARGVDGRPFPWGDFVDPAFAHIRTAAMPRNPRRIGACPEDLSPYGVEGMGGNVRDWCADRFAAEQPASIRQQRSISPDAGPADVRAVRGGSWRLPAESARVTTRTGLRADQGHPDVGFRLARSL